MNVDNAFLIILLSVGAGGITGYFLGLNRMANVVASKIMYLQGMLRSLANASIEAAKEGGVKEDEFIDKLIAAGKRRGVTFSLAKNSNGTDTH